MISLENFDFTQYSVPQRMALIERIWESIEDKRPLVSDAQWEALDRRAAEYEAAGERGVPWTELKRRVGEKA